MEPRRVRSLSTHQGCLLPCGTAGSLARGVRVRRAPIPVGLLSKVIGLRGWNSHEWVGGPIKDPRGAANPFPYWRMQEEALSERNKL